MTVSKDDMIQFVQSSDEGDYSPAGEITEESFQCVDCDTIFSTFISKCPNCGKKVGE